MGGGGESGFLVERCIGEVVGAGRSLSIGGAAAGHAHSAAASACTATMRHVTIPPCIFVSVAGKYSRRSGSPALSTSPMQSSEPRKYFATPSLPPLSSFPSDIFSSTPDSCLEEYPRFYYYRAR